MKTFLKFVLIPLSLALTACSSSPSVHKLADTLIDPRALTIDGIYGQAINGQAFQKEMLTSFHGYQYVAYYDEQKHVCVARRKLDEEKESASREKTGGGGGWEVLRLTDYTQHHGNDDAHNVVSLGICPADGTLHLAFDHHTHPLNYRVSRQAVATEPEKTPWQPNLFGPVTDRLENPEPRVSYPAFLQTPTGGLQLFWRRGTSGNGSWLVADYSPATAKWTGTREFISSEGTFTDADKSSLHRCAYPNGFNYAPDGTLFTSWTWREDFSRGRYGNGSNHDICFAMSNDSGHIWLNNAGQTIARADPGEPINVNSPGIAIVPLDQQQCLMNQQIQAVDSKGQLHLLMWHRLPGTAIKKVWEPDQSAYYHYWRDDAGTWKRNRIPAPVGTRPYLLFDKHDNAFAVFTNNLGKALDQDLYYPEGQLVIARASAKQHWTDWQIAARDQGPYLNELKADAPRLLTDGILSIVAQSSPTSKRQPTALHVLDFSTR